MDSDFMEQLWSQSHYGTPLAIIFTMIPTVAVALRLYAKRKANRDIELSDYFTVASWAITVGFFATMLVAVYLPASYLNNPDGIDTPVSKITFSLNLLWAGACYCCKLSILCLYHRILSTPSDTFRLVVRLMFALTVCTGLASCLGFLLIFQDMSTWWTRQLTENPGALRNLLKMNEAIDILSLLTDVIIFAMPMPVLSRLSLNPQQKRLLIILFSLGFLTCIEVTIRIITTYGFNGALDAIQIQCLLMGIEPAMGITLCSLPIFFRLFRKKRDGADTEYYAGSARHNNFYPIGPSSTKRSTTRDPDGALLESIDMTPLGKPKPVLIQTEITVQSSKRYYDDSLGSREDYWK